MTKSTMLEKLKKLKEIIANMPDKEINEMWEQYIKDNPPVPVGSPLDNFAKSLMEEYKNLDE